MQEAVKIVEDDLRERMMSQTTIDGGQMPKKKFPQRSKDPNHFLIDSGQSWPLVTKYVTPTKATITVTRPEILTLPNPLKGFVQWFGVPKHIQQKLLEVTKTWLKKG